MEKPQLCFRSQSSQFLQQTDSMDCGTIKEKYSWVDTKITSLRKIWIPCIQRERTKERYKGYMAI